MSGSLIIRCIMSALTSVFLVEESTYPRFWGEGWGNYRHTNQREKNDVYSRISDQNVLFVMPKRVSSNETGSFVSED